MYCTLYIFEEGKNYVVYKALPAFKQNFVSDILSKLSFLDSAVCTWHIELDGYSFQFE